MASDLPCRFPECYGVVHNGGYCSAHRRQKAKGEVLHPVKYQRRTRAREDVLVSNNAAFVLLYDKTGKVQARALIDIEDADRVRGNTWSLRSRNYVRGKGPKFHGGLHRFIMNAPAAMEVDHIDGNPLNNQKTNLRLVTHKEQTQNVAHPGREQLRGVSYNERCVTNPWIARVNSDGVHYTVSCPTLEDARREAGRLRDEFFTHHVPTRHQ